MASPTKVERKLTQDLAAVKLQLAKKTSLKVYITVAIIAIVLSSAVTFQAKWVPVAKDGISKVVKIVTPEKATEEEVEAPVSE